MPSPGVLAGPIRRGFLAATRNGDRNALGRLMEAFRGHLLAVADGELARGVRPKAQPSDVVQDAFLEASRLFARFGGEEVEQFRAWLRSILLYKVLDANKRYLNTAKRDPAVEQSLHDSGLRDTLPGCGPTPSGTASRDEDAWRVAAALGRLPAADRQVIVWRNWDGVPFTEIGRRLDRSEDAARMLFARALERLQDELEVGDVRPD